MSVAVDTRTRPTQRIRQRASHRHLLKDVSSAVAPPSASRRGRLDALIVPSSRPASALRGPLVMSAWLETPLIVLASRRCNLEQVAQRVAETPGARALVIEIPDLYPHEWFRHRTNAFRSHEASGERDSDLSLKRNVGLVLARMLGLTKVAFLDDDIVNLRIDDLSRMSIQLGRQPVAGMIVNEFPDNSVVCHARRLAGLEQDNFVSGAVLGVNCSDHPLPFFPDIYNEDWFFFARSAATRSLPQVGYARQDEYDPFASIDRARTEEFGDLLAEGLYALLGSGNPVLSLEDHLQAAGVAFWSRFREARRLSLIETTQALEHKIERESWHDSPLHSALNSLSAAQKQLARISPTACAQFIEDWQQDMADWQRICARTSTLGGIHEALDTLELKNWRVSEFGNDDAKYTSLFGGLSG